MAFLVRVESGGEQLASALAGAQCDLASPILSLEEKQEFVTDDGWAGVSGQLMQQLHQRFHLPEVRAAVPARAEVEGDAHALRERQLPLEMVRHQLGEVLASEHV